MPPANRVLQRGGSRRAVIFPAAHEASTSRAQRQRKHEEDSEVARWLDRKPDDYRKEKMGKLASSSSLPNLSRAGHADVKLTKLQNEDFSAAGELKVQLQAEVEAMEQLARKKKDQVEQLARKHVGLQNTRQRKEAKLAELKQKLHDAVVEYQTAYKANAPVRNRLQLATLASWAGDLGPKAAPRLGSSACAPPTAPA